MSGCSLFLGLMPWPELGMWVLFRQMRGDEAVWPHAFYPSLYSAGNSLGVGWEGATCAEAHFYVSFLSCHKYDSSKWKRLKKVTIEIWRFAIPSPSKASTCCLKHHDGDPSVTASWWPQDTFVRAMSVSLEVSFLCLEYLMKCPSTSDFTSPSDR